LKLALPVYYGEAIHSSSGRLSTYRKSKKEKLTIINEQLSMRSEINPLVGAEIKPSKPF
jgi:hypothetical protein